MASHCTGSAATAARAALHTPHHRQAQIQLKLCLHTVRSDCIGTCATAPSYMHVHAHVPGPDCWLCSTTGLHGSHCTTGLQSTGLHCTTGLLQHPNHNAPRAERTIPTTPRRGAHARCGDQLRWHCACAYVLSGHSRGGRRRCAGGSVQHQNRPGTKLTRSPQPAHPKLSDGSAEALSRRPPCRGAARALAGVPRTSEADAAASLLRRGFVRGWARGRGCPRGNPPWDRSPRPADYKRPQPLSPHAYPDTVAVHQIKTLRPRTRSRLRSQGAYRTPSGHCHSTMTTCHAAATGSHTVRPAELNVQAAEAKRGASSASLIMVDAQGGGCVAICFGCMHAYEAACGCEFGQSLLVLNHFFL